ncbi:MAG: MBL fold metallo-hydrolase [Bacteroidota bacterium]
MNFLLSAHFKFYPVGQGCFYAGEILAPSNDKKFTIVFDCGTLSGRTYLQNSIQKFKQKYTKIDLLVISHFDEDHVNGVNDLLDGISCETVLIPYYTPLSRLGLFADNSSNNPDYDLFLRNPTSYFLQEKFKVSKVIVIGNNNEGSIELNSNEKPTKPDNDLTGEKIEFDFDKFENDSGFLKYVQEQEGNNFNNNDKINYLSFPLKISFKQKFWEFVFYLKYFKENAKILNFKTAIDNLLISIKSNNIQDLFDNISLRASVRKAYKDTINGNVNYSSIVLYHGPTIVNSWACTCENCDNCFDDLCNYCCDYKKTGTLLTGDSFLKIPADFDPFFDYYGRQDYIKKCFLLQVPHHGSKNNWKIFPNGLEYIPFFVFNHGIGRVKHPSREVLDDFIHNINVRRLKFNNEGQKVSYFINCYQ